MTAITVQLAGSITTADYDELQRLLGESFVQGYKMVPSPLEPSRFLPPPKFQLKALISEGENILRLEAIVDGEGKVPDRPFVSNTIVNPELFASFGSLTELIRAKARDLGVAVATSFAEEAAKNFATSISTFGADFSKGFMEGPYSVMKKAMEEFAERMREPAAKLATAPAWTSMYASAPLPNDETAKKKVVLEFFEYVLKDAAGTAFKVGGFWNSDGIRYALEAKTLREGMIFETEEHLLRVVKRQDGELTLQRRKKAEEDDGTA